MFIHIFQVLDEIIRIVQYIIVAENPPRAHELLQELRDISSMAMEHFDEVIVPRLKTHMPALPSYNLNTSYVGEQPIDFLSQSGKL